MLMIPYNLDNISASLIHISVLLGGVGDSGCTLLLT